MKYFYFYIIAIICIVSCNNTDSSKNKYKIFKNYLNKQFDRQIPLDNHFYYIIPKKPCIGCYKKALLHYKRECKNSDTNCTIIISAIQDFESFSKKINIQNADTLLDFKNNIAYTKLNIINASLVITNNKNVLQLKEFKVDSPNAN